MTKTIPLVVADFLTSLSSQVNTGDTTATLTSILDTDGNALANGLYGFTIDADVEDKKEYFIATLTGLNLTNVVSVSDQNVATTGFLNYHRRSASVAITDWVVLGRLAAVLSGATALDGNVPLAYDSTPALGSGLQLATVQYVLNAISSTGVVSFNSEIIAGVAGETITVGQWMYLNGADGRWYKTDATVLSKSVGVRVGKALGAGTAGAAIASGVFVEGLETSGTYTAFTTYYLSNTPGAISTSAGTNSVNIGSTDANAKLIYGLLTASQRNALSGSSGTPSSSNPFVTQLATSVSGTDQSQLFLSGTVAVGEANTTTRRNKAAQPFIPTKTQIKGVSLYKSANTGTFTGNVSIAIQADTAGSPSGTDLISKTITNVLYNAYNTGEFLALFGSEITVVPGSQYWIVVTTSTADTANCIKIGTYFDSFTSGGLKYFNSTDGWLVISNTFFYYKTIEGSSAKAIVGDSLGLASVTTRKILTKIGAISLSNAGSVTVVHGFGRIPSIVELNTASGSSSEIDISNGLYDVPTNSYATSFGYYNEGSAGGNAISTSAILVLALGATTSGIIGVDENIVIFGPTNTATVYACAYKILG